MTDSEAADLIQRAGQREVFCMKCDGCGREVRAPSVEKRTERFMRHVRNCAALNFGRAPQ